MSPEGPSSSTEPPAETLFTSTRRRVSLPASSSYPFLNQQQPGTSSSNPLSTQHSSTLLACPPPSSTTSAAPLPPPPPNRILQAAPPSRLHQRARSSGYGGLDQINQAGPSTFLSRSVSTGGAAGSGGTGAQLVHPQVSSSSSIAEPGPKRQRKKWSEDETKQLVDGCNKWGVGSWKAILDDPAFTFQDRTAVDLKDRFRTSFPVAYHQLYPGAKTHVPSSIGTDSKRDESGLKLEKKDVKKKRPFSASEDLALKSGFDQHGAAWAKISKDAIFQGRKSIDLRDRFRNVFPDLYSKAGFKPRLTRAKTTPVPNTVDETGSLSDFGSTPTPSSASSSSGRRAASAFGFTSASSSQPSSATTTSPLPLSAMGVPFASRTIAGSSSADRRRSASVVESSEPSSSTRPRRPPSTARRASFSNTSTVSHPYLPAPSSASTPSASSSSYPYHPPLTPATSFTFAYPDPPQHLTASPQPPLPSQPDFFAPHPSLSTYPQPSDLIPHRSWSNPATTNAPTYEHQSPPRRNDWGAGGASSNFISDEQHTLGGSSSTSSWLPSHYGLPEDFGGDLGGLGGVGGSGGSLPWPSASDSGAPDGDYAISETGSSATTPAPSSTFRFTHHPTAGDLIYSSSARGPTLFNLDHLTLPAMGMDLAMGGVYPSNYADTSGSSFDVDLDLDLELMSDGGESAASMRLAASKMQIGQQQHQHQHQHSSYSDSHHPFHPPPPPSSHQSEPNLSFYTTSSSSSSFAPQQPFTPQHPPILEPPPLPSSSQYLSSPSWPLNLSPNLTGLSSRLPAWTTPTGTTQDDINLDGGEGFDKKRKRVASKVGGEESGLHWLDLSMFGGDATGGGGSGGGGIGGGGGS